MKEKFLGEIVVGLAAFIIATLTTAFTPLGDILREQFFPTKLTVEGHVLRSQLPTAAEVMLDGLEETKRSTDHEGQFYFVEVPRGDHCYSVVEIGGRLVWVDNFYIAPGATEKVLVTTVDVASGIPSQVTSLDCLSAIPEVPLTPEPVTTFGTPGPGANVGSAGTPAAVTVGRALPTFEVIFDDLEAADNQEEISTLVEEGNIALATVVAAVPQTPVNFPDLDPASSLPPTPAIEFSRAFPTFTAVFRDLETIRNTDEFAPLILEGNSALATVEVAVTMEATALAIAAPAAPDYRVTLNASGEVPPEMVPGDIPSDAHPVSVSIAADRDVLDRIEHVTYFLDPSLSPSVVTRSNSDDGFALLIAPQAPFELTADVLFEDGHIEQVIIPISSG